jgi:hypothetical protein
MLRIRKAGDPSDGLPGSYAPEQTFNDAGQKSSSRKLFVDALEARFWTDK